VAVDKRYNPVSLAAAKNFINAVFAFEEFNVIRCDGCASAANQMNMRIMAVLQIVFYRFEKWNVTAVVRTDSSEMNAFLDNGFDELVDGQVITAKDHFNTALFQGVGNDQDGSVVAVIAFDTNETANFMFGHIESKKERIETKKLKRAFSRLRYRFSRGT